ncbi:MAG: hypothetical protein IRY89_00105 [Pseudolabrys sp.]|nr:hypothetical protein [Pseudolabrys sp.]
MASNGTEGRKEGRKEGTNARFRSFPNCGCQTHDAHGERATNDGEVVIAMNANDRRHEWLRDSSAEIDRTCERIEILLGALIAFSRPIPGYDATFRHLDRIGLSNYQLRQPSDQRS